MFGRRDRQMVEELLDRVRSLEHEAELMRTVLIVKEPQSVMAAQSYDGLRKQIVAGAAERRSHLTSWSPCTWRPAGRTTSTTSDLSWRSGCSRLGSPRFAAVATGEKPRDVFEDLTGQGLDGPEGFEVVEPAYVDEHTGALIRLGRAQRPGSGLAERQVGAEDRSRSPTRRATEPASARGRRTRTTRRRGGRR